MSNILRQVQADIKRFDARCKVSKKKQKKKKWTVTKLDMLYGGVRWTLIKNNKFFVFVSGSKSFISLIAHLLNENDARKAKRKKKRR